MQRAVHIAGKCNIYVNIHDIAEILVFQLVNHYVVLSDKVQLHSKFNS